ncbi:MAG: sensor histidine kinase, partial [Vicinamibacterales bacterium]
GCGVVGGPLPYFVEVGRLAARQALTRLGPESASTVTVPLREYAPLVFDARQLIRWDILENRLPAGSTVLFRPPSLWRDYRREVIGALVVGSVQTLLIVVVLFERRRRTRAQAALGDSFLQLQDLAGRLITAQEAERTRIARELHDDVVQDVAGLSITLGRLAKRTALRAPAEEVKPALALLQQRTIGVAEKIRNLSHDLHPGVLQHAGLVAALTAHCAECQREQEVEVVMDADDNLDLISPESISPEASLCLYRVAQEALRNVFTHADAGKVVVRLIRTDNFATLTIADDGKGFDPKRARRGGRGLGLLSINERVRLAGGTVDVLTEPLKGTTITVRIPLEQGKTGIGRDVSETERAFG